MLILGETGGGGLMKTVFLLNKTKTAQKTKAIDF